jgi:hypothetical protein
MAGTLLKVEIRRRRSSWKSGIPGFQLVLGVSRWALNGLSLAIKSAAGSTEQHRLHLLLMAIPAGLINHPGAAFGRGESLLA